MASTHVQYQVTKQGGPFARASVTTSSPGPKEVLVQLKAIGLNPLDWKQVDSGHLVQSWPAVIGIEGAGIIKAVGPDVTSLHAGDEVFGTFWGAPKSAAYQEIAVVSEIAVSKKPANISWEEAASLPLCYATAAAAITVSLKIALPFLPGGATEGAKPRSVLVLGGSSAVGAAAVQLLRIALPDAVILATSSTKHHEHLKSLGATAAFDQKSESLIDDIKAATPGGKGVEMMLDAVRGATDKRIFDAFDPRGPKIDAEVATGADIEPPEGVTRDIIHGYDLLKVPGGINATRALTDLVEKGTYKVPLRVKIVGTGFEAVDTGLDELRAGVSGTKLVVLL